MDVANISLVSIKCTILASRNNTCFTHFGNIKYPSNTR